MTRLGRRTVLLGAAGGVVAVGTGGVLVEEGVLPGRARAYGLLGLNGKDVAIPDVRPGPRVDGSFVSQRRGGIRTGWSFTSPPGVDRFLAQVVGSGVQPFAVVSVDGGSSSYWHPRTDGSDASAMVVDELVPLVRDRFGLSTALGLYGWSMGGYGALRLALRAQGINAVAATSPALFASYADAAPGAFDSRAQFDEENLVTRAPGFPATPMRVDCGKVDPFHAQVRAFVGRLPRRPAGGFEPGAHTYGYMRRMLPAQLAFLGRSLGAS